MCNEIKMFIILALSDWFGSSSSIKISLRNTYWTGQSYTNSGLHQIPSQYKAAESGAS